MHYGRPLSTHCSSDSEYSILQVNSECRNLSLTIAEIFVGDPGAAVVVRAPGQRVGSASTRLIHREIPIAITTTKTRIANARLTSMASSATHKEEKSPCVYAMLGGRALLSLQ